jgi:hypothetical protein
MKPPERVSERKLAAVFEAICRSCFEQADLLKGAAASNRRVL